MLVFLASIWTPNCATKELCLETFSLSVGHLACVRLISFRLYLRVLNSSMMSFFSSFSILQMELARDVLNPSVHISVSGSSSSCTEEFSHVFVFSSCQCTALFTRVCVSYFWWVCKVCHYLLFVGKLFLTSLQGVDYHYWFLRSMLACTYPALLKGSFSLYLSL